MASTEAKPHDIEKGGFDSPTEKPTPVDVESIEPVGAADPNARFKGLWKQLAGWNVELRGVQPIPREEQTKSRYNYLFFLWLAVMTNPLPYVSPFYLP